MISDKDALEIVAGLLRKTKANEVNWQSDDSGSMTSFYFKLPESRVEVDFYSPSAAPDYYRVSFFNKYNQEVKGLKVEEEEAGWETVRELHDEIGRVVLEWDRVLEDLREAIRHPGVISS